jgi:hypothetical protein
MLRFPLALLGASILVSVAANVPGGGLLKKAAGEFRRSGTELDRIEEREGAEVAAGEIALARRWIEEGFALLKKGHERQAAVLAERLPVQLNLIRAMLASRLAEVEADREEAEAHELGKSLERLKARYDRLVLLHRGAEASNAFPRKKDQE